MALTTQDLLDYLYYRCIPKVYIAEDKKLKYPLYRYLQGLLFGGFSGNIEDIDNIITLVDPENCPAEYFPLLYESFGLTYFPDVDIKYHRKFLMNFGELSRRRGMYSCVRYLVRALTSMNVEQTYLRGVYNDAWGRHLICDLKARTIQDILNLDTSIRVIEQFLALFVPYYITTHLTGSIENQVVSTTYYMANAVCPRPHYEVRPPIVIKSQTLKVRRKNLVTSALSYEVTPFRKISASKVRHGGTVVPRYVYEVRPEVVVKSATSKIGRFNVLSDTKMYKIGRR